MYQLDPKANIPVPDDDSLYLYINNDIEYRLFEDIVDSYYLDSQIKDDFHCNQDCYTHISYLYLYHAHMHTIT